MLGEPQTGARWQLHALTFTDPFGLCEPKPQCEALVHAYEATGAVVGAWFGGGTTLATSLATGGAAAMTASAQVAAGSVLGTAIGHVVGELASWAMQSSDGGGGSLGNTGGTSHTVGGARIGRQQVRVDVEYPTGGSSGNVHVQWNGPGGPGKRFLDDAESLQRLPRAIRVNPAIQRAVGKAFDLLNRFVP